MSFKLDNLIIENMNSFLGEHVLSFKKKQGNLVLINGVDLFDRSSNGSGKSTIVDAIVFAFFGRSLKKELNLDDLVCNKSTEPLKITLSFEDSSDGIIKNRYRIERTRSKIPAYTQCGLFENEVCISDNLTLTETQTKIESLIGLDFQMFCNNNVLNPELFRFIKGNNAHKIDILERVLNLNIISKLFFQLSRVEKEDELVYNSNEKEFYALTTTLDSLLKQEEEVNKNIQETIESIENINVKLNNEHNNLNDDLKTYMETIKGISENIISLNQEILDLGRENVKLDHNILELDKRIKYYSKNDHCHACKQPIANREEMLKNEKEKLIQHKLEIKEIETKILILQANELFKIYEKALENKTTTEADIKNKSSLIAQNLRTIAKFKTITSEASKIEEIKEKLSIADQEFNESKNLYSITGFWRELLTPKSKTRMDITSTLLHTLNSTIQKYINNFYNKDIRMHFSIQDNNINETIVIGGNKFKYDQMSSGEKQKIDIIIVLALLDIAMTHFKNNKLKFLIADEAFDHLDPINITKALEFIRQYSVNLNTMVLIITHSAVAEESSWIFDNKITITKDINSSFIQ